MTARWMLVALAACKSPPNAPSTASGSAPAPAPPDAAVAVVADAATPDAAAANTGTHATLITRKEFGPYRAGEPVTQASLEKMFGVKLETTDYGGGEGAEGDPAWVHRSGSIDTDGGVGRLLVMKDGSLWVTSARKLFHDEHGLMPGITSDKLVSTIKDLACENIEAEEPEFSCWSKAAPELRYVGMHGYKLDNGFSKAKLAKLALEVDHFEWRPKKSR